MSTPTVRTIGDLTIRQLRARPQIRIRVGDDVGTVYTGRRDLGLLTERGYLDVTLNTPCEVIA